MLNYNIVQGAAEGGQGDAEPASKAAAYDTIAGQAAPEPAAEEAPAGQAAAYATLAQAAQGGNE